MNQLLRAALLALVSLSGSVKADVIWVGIGPQCTGFNVRNSVPDALALAEIIAGPDEIRLTSTTSNLYLGPGSQLDLVDWDPATKGALTIAGGYSDCFTSQTSVSRIGDASGPLIRVSATSGAQSVVTLQNLVISGSTSLRGLLVVGDSSVFLQNTLIENNIAGAFVSGGAFLDIDADSRIQSNDDGAAGTGFGGGLRCEGANSEVALRGRLVNNRGVRGGNLYAQSGCLVRLLQGAQINDGSAAFGGGAYIDNGATLLASGSSNRVAFIDNFAEEGGGLYVTGTGEAVMTNTLFRDNGALIGSGIYAIDGGRNASPQVSMDRASSCPFLISCSEFEGNSSLGPTIFAGNSTVQIQRTLFDSNATTEESVAWATIYLAGADAFINRVGFIDNETYAPIGTTGGDVLIRHVTAVGNTFPNDPGLDSWAMTVRNSFDDDDDFEVYNSVFADTRGHDGPPFGRFAGACNLVDDTNNWPSGTFIQGTAQFINAAGGDLRQQPTSPGVDMCNAQPGAPANDRDLEFQLAPVNEFTNPQGQPGQTGGLWDAGVDEVYSTVGDDEFTLTVARGGSGSGFVISDPLGISCGSNCSETYFQGTLVALTATPTGGSVFTGWVGCPLPNGNECFNTMDADRTITAIFDTDEFTLSVNLNGPGSGTVTSSPAGINCGTDCSEIYAVDTLVTLTASADPGSMFVNWIGCPLPNGDQCLNTVDGDRTVTAVFDAEQFGLDVEKVGTGEGLVVSSPAGINCGSDCSQLYLPDTLVTLTATADVDNLFLRWVECPSPIGNQCQLTMTEDQMISARFEDEDVIFADQFEFE